MQIRGLSKDKRWDYENGFYWFSSPARLNKMLAHYELYKMIKDLSGDICELGVYKGASLIRFATFRATFENNQARRIIGFDAFGQFPTDNITLKSDLDFINSFESAGNTGLSTEEINSILKEKEMSNIQLIKGNIMETLPIYLGDNPHTRLALLHLDMDTKEPTAFALERLYDKVVNGGLIIIDDYNAVNGATEAVDAFINKKGLNVKLQKMPHYNVPAFIIKES